MEALIQQTTSKKLQQGMCLSGDELTTMGILPADDYCFSYHHYVLYQRDNKRIILKPLPHNLFKVIREYNFLPAS